MDPEERPRRGRSATVAAAIEAVAEEVVRNVKAEADELRRGVVANAGAAARGTGYLAGSASLGAVSVVALGSLPIIALRKVLPGSVIAVGIAAGSAAGAVALARRGVGELRVAAPPSVERRLDEAIATVADSVRARLGPIG